ncbi:MAG: TraR/DksA family transcriptional regulator [Planctomycetes bacterium]|nr:TraR/DksA family transcriptional regulator [Planctomycetota bacterium]
MTQKSIPVATLTKAQIKPFKKLLIQYLQHLGVKLENMEEAVLRPDTDNGPEDGDDFGAGVGLREFQLGLIENENEILHEVRAALKRIDGGAYGLCLHCNEPIPIGRLEARPYARFCLEHQLQYELGQLDID